MNNLKYVMLPRIEEKPKEVKQQPWYRERLREKYLKKGGKTTTSSSGPSSQSTAAAAATAHKERLLNPKDWVFIREGLDDFRDGLPPSHDDVVIKPDKGPSPMLKSNKKFSAESRPRLNLNQRCFSKSLPLAQARREKIEELIANLSQHPLALYSHLEEALPPDLFEEIVQILDPELNQGLAGPGGIAEGVDERDEDATGDTASATGPGLDSFLNKDNESQTRRSRRDIRDEINRLEESLKRVNAGQMDESDEQKTIRNKYKWLLKKEEAKARAKGPDPEQIKAEAIDNHIKKVTVEFCEWVKSLGGEHNIDPLTLTSLFASGYETKPPISVPIHVVELTNIPLELRQNAYVPLDVVNEDEELEKTIYRNENTSSRTGKRYGAWYLPKEHWRLMPRDEKLVDPKAKLDEQELETKRRAEEINTRLAPLHGAQAFKTFIKNKRPNRVPKLLVELDHFEKEQASRSRTKMSHMSSSMGTDQANMRESVSPSNLPKIDNFQI